MKLTPIRPNKSGENKYKFYAKVIKIIPNGKEHVLLLEKISGKDKGKLYYGAQNIDPNYKGKTLDKEGIASLRIKTGCNVIINEATQLSDSLRNEYFRFEDDSNITAVTARRINIVSGDFKPDSTLVISSWGADENNISGYLVKPQRGDYIEVGENEDINLKKKNVNELASKVKQKRNEGEGLFIVVTSVSDRDGELVTLFKFISAYHKDTNQAEARLLTDKEFNLKIDEFLADGRVTNFMGTAEASVAEIMKERFDIAILPAASIFITRSSNRTDARRIITGIGTGGVAVDPGSPSRKYPIIQNNGVEAAGLLGFREKQEIDGKVAYVGPKIITQPGSFMYQRFFGQIDLYKDRGLITVEKFDNQPEINKKDHADDKHNNQDNGEIYDPFEFAAISSDQEEVVDTQQIHQAHHTHEVIDSSDEDYWPVMSY